MKKTLKIIIGLMFLGVTVVNAQVQDSIADNQTKTEKFKVWGNCGMCEKTIEKAANAVEGVASASWDKETKIIEVSFDDTKTDLHKIHQSIANSGYDTEMHKGNDEAYNALPGCCQYDRKE